MAVSPCADELTGVMTWALNLAGPLNLAGGLGVNRGGIIRPQVRGGRKGGREYGQRHLELGSIGACGT